MSEWNAKLPQRRNHHWKKDACSFSSRRAFGNKFLRPLRKLKKLNEKLRTSVLGREKYFILSKNRSTEIYHHNNFISSKRLDNKP